MVQHNITVLDSSPLIVYTGDWVVSYPSFDQETPANTVYYVPDSNSWHRTDDTGSFAFNFTGNAVYVYASALDGVSVMLSSGNNIVDNVTVNSHISSLMQYGQQVYFKENLNQSEAHSLNMGNVGQGPFVLDYIVVGNAIGDGFSQQRNLFMDDTSTAFNYTPGTWSQTDGTSSHLTGYLYNGTERSTSEMEAQVTLTFWGCGVGLHGTWSTGKFTARLDNHDPVLVSRIASSSQTTINRPGEIIYLYQGLEEDNHTLTLINKVSGTQDLSTLSIDYAIITTIDPSNLDGVGSDGTNTSHVISISGSPSPTQSTSNQPFHSSNNTSDSLRTGVIIGSVIGGIMTILVLVLIGLFMRRRRRKAQLILDATGLFEEDSPSSQEVNDLQHSFPHDYAQIPHRDSSPWMPRSLFSKAALSHAHMVNSRFPELKNNHGSIHIPQPSHVDDSESQRLSEFHDVSEAWSQAVDTSPNTLPFRLISASSPTPMVMLPQQELDGGVSLLRSSEVNTVPPRYDPIWTSPSTLAEDSGP